MTTLNEIRENLTEAQRAIINAVWEDHLERESWHDWITPEALYRKFAKPMESRRYGKDYVLTALSSFSGSILVEQERGYVLTFLGMLLTDQCQNGIDLLVRYLELVQSKYDAGLEIKEIKFSNEELGEMLRISEGELKALRELIDYGRFGGVSGSKDTWHVNASNYMDEVLVEDDLKVYIERQALKDYDPALPVSHRERSRYLYEKQTKESSLPKQMDKSGDPYRIVGTILAQRYELIAYAGAGGMGAVYKAVDNEDEDTVAVKILKPDIAAKNPEYFELFNKEVRAAQQLNHPNIVRVLNSGIDNEIAYMIMEWIEGKSLEDAIAEAQLPLNRIIKIFDQVCSAVACAHDNNVIHLDLKPANILLIPSEQAEDSVKVIDFGLARVITKESGTTVTRFRGTHQFCAPEQFGGRVSKRSDVYSLGATLYYLIAGVIPFGGSYINAKLHPNLELPEIPSPSRHRSFPSEIDHVIRKSLNKDPNLRQQTVRQLFEEFNEATLLSDGSHKSPSILDKEEAALELTKNEKIPLEIKQDSNESTRTPRVTFGSKEKPVLSFRRLPAFLLILGTTSLLMAAPSLLIASPRPLNASSYKFFFAIISSALAPLPLLVVKPKRLPLVIAFLLLISLLRLQLWEIHPYQEWPLIILGIASGIILSVAFAYDSRLPYRVLGATVGYAFAETILRGLTSPITDLMLREDILGIWASSGGLAIIVYWLGILLGDYLGVFLLKYNHAQAGHISPIHPPNPIFESHLEALNSFAREVNMPFSDFNELWKEHVEIYQYELSVAGADKRTELGDRKYWVEKYERLKDKRAKGPGLF